MTQIHTGFREIHLNLSSKMHIIPTQSPKAFRSICTSDIFFEKAILVKKSSLNNPPKGFRWIKNSRNVSFTIQVRGTSPEKIIHRNSKTSYAWTVSPKSSAKNYYFKMNVFSIYTESFPEDYSSKSFREKCWNIHRNLISTFAEIRS